MLIHRIEFTRPDFDACTSFRVEGSFLYGGPTFEVEVEGDQITRVLKERKTKMIGFGKADLETLVYMPDAWTKSFIRQCGAAILKAVAEYKANPPLMTWADVVARLGENGSKLTRPADWKDRPVAWERPIIPL
jgi:hypothetical protein